jgi:serine/threonine protein kinase
MSDEYDLSAREDDPDTPELVAALREYQTALAAGARPDREEFLARYPEVADELADCIDGLDFLHTAAPGLLPSGSSEHPALHSQPDGTLGDFRLIREIGRGGMGVVYEAVQISLGRRVALKVLPFAATLDARQLRRFENEARAAAQLHHSHIVPVHAVGCDRGVHYYAMQLIDGVPLSEVIDHLRQSPRAARADADTADGAAAITRQPTDSREFFRTVAGLGVQAADALEYAHQMGVVHRDVKPGNLLVDGRGHLWVTDFGLARFAAAPGTTAPGDLVGTLRYMSPEQAAGEPVIDPRGDVYSLGATLYELLTLRPAVPAEDRQECLRQLLETEPPPPRAINRAVPVELETVVLKAMAKSPADRYPTAAELAADLRRFLDDRPVHARRPSTIDRARRWARRHTTTLAVAIGVLGLVVLGLAATIALVTREHVLTRAAYDRELQKTEEAEQRYRLARRAIDEMIHFGEDELADAPHLRPLRQRLAEIALAYYEELIELRKDDPGAQAELAVTRNKVERVLEDIAALQGAGQIFLLGESGILTDLKLTAEQRTQVADLLARARGRGESMCYKFHRLSATERRHRFAELARQNEADIANTLTVDQVHRLRQIARQREGLAAFRAPDVLAALQLTTAQRDRIRTIEFETNFGPPPGVPRLGPQGTAYRPSPQTIARAVKRAEGVLTAEQTAAWKELVGEPYSAPRPGPAGPSSRGKP